MYRNIFEERKYVEVYLGSDAKNELGLERHHFVALAMLLGGGELWPKEIPLKLPQHNSNFLSSLLDSSLRSSQITPRAFEESAS